MEDTTTPIRIPMLTTIDNPFNPFTQFDEWKSWDEQSGYNSCEYLARIMRSSDDLPDTLQLKALSDAIDEIVQLNILGVYRKVYEPV